MPPTEDEHRDVVDFIAAIIYESHRQADQVAEFLRSIGMRPPIQLPEDVLLKLAALVRLWRWEAAGVAARIQSRLPSSSEVYTDLVCQCRGATPEIDGRELNQRVLMVYIREFAWQQSSSYIDAIVTQSVPANDLLDNLASLLWGYRHLATGPGENQND